MCAIAVRQGTWPPAVVCRYEAAKSAHDVRVQDTNSPKGPRCRADRKDCMPAKAKPAARARKTAANQTASAPVRLFVRRGAERRFEKLKEKTANLDVEISWDRREADRRSQAGPPVTGERRKQDRRAQPSFTWDVADFAVVVQPAPKD